VAPYKSRQSAPHRSLQARAQRSETGHLVYRNLLADTPEASWANGFESEVAFYQAPCRFAHHHRTGACHRLHASGEINGMSDRRFLHLRFTGLDGTHHHSSCIYSNPDLNRRSAPTKEFVAVAVDVVLHAQHRIERAVGVVFMCERSAEQGENTITGRLHH